MRETGGGRTKIQKFLLTSRGVDSIIIFPFCPAAVTAMETAGVREGTRGGGRQNPFFFSPTSLTSVWRKTNPSNS